jgi:hypothetical protein
MGAILSGLVVARVIKLFIRSFGGLCLFVSYEKWGGGGEDTLLYVHTAFIHHRVDMRLPGSNDKLIRLAYTRWVSSGISTPPDVSRCRPHAAK